MVSWGIEIEHWFNPYSPNVTFMYSLKTSVCLFTISVNVLLMGLVFEHVH